VEAGWGDVGHASSRLFRATPTHERGVGRLKLHNGGTGFGDSVSPHNHEKEQ